MQPEFLFDRICGDEHFGLSCDVCLRSRVGGSVCGQDRGSVSMYVCEIEGMWMWVGVTVWVWAGALNLTGEASCAAPPIIDTLYTTRSPHLNIGLTPQAQ